MGLFLLHTRPHTQLGWCKQRARLAMRCIQQCQQHFTGRRLAHARASANSLRAAAALLGPRHAAARFTTALTQNTLSPRWEGCPGAKLSTQKCTPRRQLSSAMSPTPASLGYRCAHRLPCFLCLNLIQLDGIQGPSIGVLLRHLLLCSTLQQPVRDNLRPVTRCRLGHHRCRTSSMSMCVQHKRDLVSLRVLCWVCGTS